MKHLILIAALAFAASAQASAKQPERADRQKQEQKQAEQRRDERPSTLDRAKPDKPPGEGFLINGREGSALDKGRPDQRGFNDWDLWRKK